MTDDKPMCIGSRAGQPCGREVARPFLCERCRLRMRSTIGRMPAHLLLASYEVGRETGSRGVTRTSSEPLVPGQWWLELTTDVRSVHDQTRADIVAIGDAVTLPKPAAAVLTGWAQLVAEERGAYLPWLPVNPVAQLATLSRWWDSHSDWCSSQPFADEWQTEVNDAAGQLIRAAGLHRDVHGVAGECPQCHRDGHLRRYGPRRPQGSVIIACDRDEGCGLVMTEDEHDRWVIALTARDGTVKPKRHRRPRCECGHARLKHGPDCLGVIETELDDGQWRREPCMCQEFISADQRQETAA